jgi:hypothetical protein
MTVEAVGDSVPQILTGDNPFNVDPDHYKRSHQPDYDNPMWSETHFWSCWSPKERVGFYVHVGTTPEDADLWWAQVMIYLPDGNTLADRSWGRSPQRNGPTTGNFSSRGGELGYFTLKYDGAGELCTPHDMATRVVGAGESLPCQFEVEIAPAMPVWSLWEATTIGRREWAGLHHEQVHTAKGWLKIPGSKGGQWNIDGVSFRDHSIGHRDFSPLGGDHLFGVHFPDSGRSVQVLMMWNNNGELEVQAASIWENGQLELVGDVELGGVTHGSGKPNSLHKLTGEPFNFDLKLRRLGGDVIVCPIEVQHGMNQSNTDPNTNLNGSALYAGDHALLLSEIELKITWPDGEVGYGHLERGYRRHLLPEGAI